MITYKKFILEHSSGLNPVVYADGTKEWFDEKDRLDRKDGPARIRANGTQEWFQQGRRHREDGPAIVGINGKKFWYLDDFAIDKHMSISNIDKWNFLRNDLESIDIIGHPTQEMQEYVIQRRPDLINKIDNLDPRLQKKYAYELELGNVDI